MADAAVIESTTGEIIDESKNETEPVKIFNAGAVDVASKDNPNPIRSDAAERFADIPQRDQK